MASPMSLAAVPPVAAGAPDERAEAPPEQRGAIQAEAPSEHRASPAGARQFHFSYLRRLAKHSFARNEARAARWAATPKHASWLQNFLHQLNGRSRNPQRS